MRRLGKLCPATIVGQTRKTIIGFLMLFVALAVIAVPAKADTIYQLTADNCSGGCNPGAPGTSMGTVDLHQLAPNEVQVTVALVSPLQFVNTGLQNTIDFDLTGNTPGSSSVTFSNFTNPNFGPTGSQTADTFHFDGFGDFEYSVVLNTAQGAGGKQPSPLVFDVTQTGLTEASFQTFGPGANAFFGVDVINTTTGRTGPIAAVLTPVSTTPEPSTDLMLGCGVLLLLVTIGRRSSLSLVRK